MQRTLKSLVAADLARKMVFLVGPRQVGKTTLAKALMGRKVGDSVEVPAPGGSRSVEIAAVRFV